MAGRQLNLVVDARTVRLIRTGVGNAVFRHLQGIEALKAAGGASRWRVSVLRHAPELELPGFRERWDGFSHLHFIETGADHTSHPGGDRWQQLTLPRLLRAIGADVVYSPAFIGPFFTGKTASMVMVHDDMIWTQKESYPAGFRYYMATMTRLSARFSDRVIFPSADARDSCASLMRLPIVRTGVVPHGADRSIFRPARRASDSPYLVCVASAEKRKNHEVLVQALKGQNTLRMRFIGFSPEQQDRIEALRQIDGGANWDVVPHAGESEIAAHLAGASMVALPSLGEGFGIPVVEAMASGTPLILSDIPVFREVAGSAARYVQAEDVDGWRNAILDVLRGSPAVDQRVATGLERVASIYTLEQCARTLLKEARRAIETRRRRGR